jgi:hypothetical protein
MTKVKLFLALCTVVMFTACHPTIAIKSITETTHPDGTKTISVTKSLQQQLNIPETKSTEEVEHTFDQ